MEGIYPPIPLSDLEKKDISFSAFPDSNSASHLGDTTFSFRIRNSNLTTSIYKGQVPFPAFTSTSSGSPSPTNSTDPFSFVNVSPFQSSSSSTSSSFKSQFLPSKSVTGLPIETDGFTYGFVFFRQKKDSEIRRGFFQKSLVLLTPHPWRGLWLRVIRKVGEQWMEAWIQDRLNSKLAISRELGTVDAPLTASVMTAATPTAQAESSEPLPSSTPSFSISLPSLPSAPIQLEPLLTELVLFNACQCISTWPVLHFPQPTYTPTLYTLPFFDLNHEMTVSLPPFNHFPQLIPTFIPSSATPLISNSTSLSSTLHPPLKSSFSTVPNPSESILIETKSPSFGSAFNQNELITSIRRSSSSTSVMGFDLSLTHSTPLTFTRTGVSSISPQNIIPTNPAPLWTIFRETLDHLWTLWEIVISAEPILVIGETPRAVSEIVWGCVELVKPVNMNQAILFFC